MILLLFLLIAIAAVVACVWHFRQNAATAPLDRLFRCLIPISAGLLLIVLLTRMAQGPGQDWNEAKLAPVVGIRFGYALYQNPTSGVMTAWIYGPVGAIVMLPTLLARNPTTAIFIGIVISYICYLAPAAWMMWLASRRRAPWLALLGLVAFAWQSLDSDALSRCLTIAAPDAPALGLATCACAAIYRNRSVVNLIISALAAVLCVWTKQNFLPLLPALLIWVALTDGAKRAGIYLAFLAGIGALVSILFLLIFGAANMWYHMVSMPRRHPWRNTEHSTFVVWLIGLHDLLATCAVDLGFLGLLFLATHLIPPNSNSTNSNLRGHDPLYKGSRPLQLKEWLTERPWMLFVLVAIFMIPASLAAYLKIGGYNNSLACTEFFVLLAAITGLVEVFSGCELTAPLRVAATGAMLLFSFVLTIKATLAGTNGFVSAWPAIVHPYQSTQQTAFAYARHHPETIYCPWNPLTTLFADGKLYHFEWGIIDRVQARETVPDEQYLKHFPAKLTKVVYPHQPQSIKALEVLVDFRTKVRDPELPDCTVYAYVSK